MIKLATRRHRGEYFFVQDICNWETNRKFDFIVAWDSIFHLPLAEQEPAVSKLCRLLSGCGVVLYTLGDSEGEHADEWRGEVFYYSSIGIKENLRVLAANGVTCKHWELDQWPQNHVVVIGVKL